MRDSGPLIQDFVAQRRWAVVGASNHHEKFGRKIFESMRGAGYAVVPVNTTLETLDDGTPVFKRVSDIPGGVDVVDLVIPPPHTLGVVKDCIEAGVKRIWFQPGTMNPEAIALAESSGVAVIADGACAMVEKRFWKD